MRASDHAALAELSMVPTMLANEQWRPVLNYEAFYEVSDQGRVRRVGAGCGSTVGRILNPSADGFGPGKVPYKRVYLYGLDRTRSVGVSILVCEAFHGPRCGDDQLVRHLNGDSLDNRAENLSWGTQSENLLDSVGHGSHVQTRKTHCPQGHEYTAENTRLLQRRLGVWRYCMTCERERDRTHRRRKSGTPTSPRMGQT